MSYQQTRTEQTQCMFQGPARYLGTRLGNCKLQIEKCKLKIKEWYTSAESQKRGTPNLQFSFCNLQFAIFSFFELTVQLLMVLALVTLASAQKKSSCIESHIKLDDSRLSAPAKLFDNDIHKSRGLSCNDCHGGDPDADTQEGAKDPRKGYLGKPKDRKSVV